MNTLKLIDGQYTPEEAKEMLLETLNSKINFYKIKNLSSEMRFGKPDLEAYEKIRELQEAKGLVNDIIQQALQDNSKLKIESTIHVYLEDAELAEAGYSRVIAC